MKKRKHTKTNKKGTTPTITKQSSFVGYSEVDPNTPTMVKVDGSPANPPSEQLAADLPQPVTLPPVPEEKPIIKEEAPPVPPRPTFSHDKLLAALYWVEDFMNRSLINFFVIGPTADSIKGNHDLAGDAIYIGVRRLEWESEPGIASGGRRLVDAIAPYAEDEGDIVYYYANNDVPVVIFVFEDEPSVTSLDQIQYHSEFFKLPNPYASFKETYDILWT